MLIKKLLGLVEMTSGLVNASFSLPEWQAAKMIFFAPWEQLIIICWSTWKSLTMKYGVNKLSSTVIMNSHLVNSI